MRAIKSIFFMFLCKIVNGDVVVPVCSTVVTTILAENVPISDGMLHLIG